MKWIPLDNGTTWPLYDAELEHMLRYGTPTREQALCAASIMSAYRQLIVNNRSDREYAVSRLKKEMKR